MENMQDLIEKPKRSQTLITICVLSFIMCGLSVLTGVYSLYQSQPEVMQKNIETIRTINPEMADQMENNLIAAQENTFTKIAPYLNFVYILLSFLGVLMMWNLNKNGFYIYAIAEILPYSSFIFMKNASVQIPGMSSDMVSKMVMIVMVIMILTDVLFVWLYSKEMKKNHS